jgi:DNA-binding transcriptional regulator YbjK
MTAPVEDGRRARGEARRRQLQQAALAVIEREGLAGVTHRAIAEQAGVPLASASYHFAGIDELAETALREATRRLIEDLADDPRERTLGHLAELIAAEVRERPGAVIGCYEFYLLAIRKPELREAALSWMEVIANEYAAELEGPSLRAFVATVDGLFLHAMFSVPPPEPAELEAALVAAWPC